MLDLGLSDMSGLELLEQMRADRALSQVPVIIYTGKDLSRDEEAELRRLAQTIIIKDVKSPERLLDETTLVPAPRRKRAAAGQAAPARPAAPQRSDPDRQEGAGGGR